ncbi:MAG: phosphatidate cytidylyltransferase [Megasphaera sp.]|jgi:phosphatidate cytidylyltransferase|uniref:phosphatidate cytidylyltransferase n=1 Tax=Megasphaera sueciensis TaxID=349094 RepID=UPI002ACB181B|nr:phosphatidate cytidylyltransferase [Megasphaera sp.]MCI1823038.1 phosphatidate cytidylyltransferase [Megasphaera sp.]
MLSKRITTGIIGAAFTIFVIYEGNWLFFAMMTILAMLGWQEYVRLMKKMDANLTVIPGHIWIVCLFFAYWFTNNKVIMLLSVIMMSWILLRTVIRHEFVKPVDSAYSLYGLIYIVGGFLSMLVLRNSMIGDSLNQYFQTAMIEPSKFIVFLLVFSTWASDTFAFAVGKLKGKKKLCPAVSPSKTVEGFFGGILGTIITAVVFSLIFKFSLLHGLVIGIIIAIMAPLGDLIESILKRVCDVKDSGNIIPGHGGILDRFDSLLFAAPAVYVYVLLIGR